MNSNTYYSKISDEQHHVLLFKYNFLDYGETVLSSSYFSSLSNPKWLYCDVIFVCINVIINIKSHRALCLEPTDIFKICHTDKTVERKIKENIDYIFLPINISISDKDGHWVLFVISMKNKQIHSYDPLSPSQITHGYAARINKSIKQNISNQFKHTNFKMTKNPWNLPKQKDSYNCGVLVICRRLYFKFNRSRWYL